jgi:hypothetical protein
MTNVVRVFATFLKGLEIRTYASETDRYDLHSI